MNHIDNNAKKNSRLESFWLPFTPNKAFKEDPRIIVSAKGHNFYTEDGREVLDAFSGLWCSNLGHNHPRLLRPSRNKPRTWITRPRLMLAIR